MIFGTETIDMTLINHLTGTRILYEWFHNPYFLGLQRLSESLSSPFFYVNKQTHIHTHVHVRAHVHLPPPVLLPFRLPSFPFVTNLDPFP